VSAPPGPPSYVPPSGQTAKTLILIGLILEVIGAVLFLFGFGITAVIFAASLSSVSVLVYYYIAGGALALVILFLVYTLCYKPVKAGHYEQARLPTLIFAILGIVTLGGIIAGVLYLIAFFKLGDAVREAAAPPMGYVAPIQPMPVAAAPVAAAPPAPVCPVCGKPGTWIPQYSRYYCYTDSRYL
jgi:hypothetical protein